MSGWSASTATTDPDPFHLAHAVGEVGARSPPGEGLCVLPVPFPPPPFTR
jgi:hypothetical protein